MIKWFHAPGMFWFRICGYGLVVSDKTINPPLFSERNGLRRWLRIGRYGIRWLS